jgi:Phosphoenolpyruvate carboxykinase (GTP)
MMEVMTDVAVPTYVRNKRFKAWLNEVVELCKPNDVRFCDGSQEEYDELCELMVRAGTFKRLNPEKRPNSFLAWSDPQRCGAA